MASRFLVSIFGTKNTYSNYILCQKRMVSRSNIFSKNTIIIHFENGDHFAAWLVSGIWREIIWLPGLGTPIHPQIV